MDRKIQDAIRQAIAEAGQDLALARKLESWFEAIASGGEDINDKQSSYRHLELLYDDTRASDIPKGARPSSSREDLLDDEERT